MATYVIEPERRTLHGSFSPELPPVLTIEPGDTVRYNGLLEAGWGLEPPKLDGSARRTFEPRILGRDDGHAMLGPLFVRGAEPGMALEIRIDRLRPGSWGRTYAGYRDNELSQRLGVSGSSVVRVYELDADNLIGRDQDGYPARLRPFLGVMGMPPAEPGIHSSSPPRPTGGNIDCKELVEGSTLYLPIAVPGGLFSIGDGHAAQGDGESSGTAIECPMELVELTCDLRDDLPIMTPRANTAAGWLTFGFDEDLDEATYVALNAMLDLIQERLTIGRGEALALASVHVDLRITQIVNGVKGVHAVLPHGTIV